jgi:hypothetical protein
LYEKVGSSYVLMSGGTENAASGNADFERLNYSGLTVGNTYYVSAGAASGSTGDAYTLCIQNLMPSGCATSVPAGGLNVCATYRAAYRGAPSQGVTYDFSFTGVGGGATGTTSVTGTNGLVILSNAALALKYGGTYDVAVAVNYNLQNGAGTAELVTVNAPSTGLCNDVQMMAQPNMEVRSTQRCPAAITRSTWLSATRVGTDALCGATTYSFEFTQVTSCSDATVVSLAPSVFTTTGASPYIQLGVLPNLSNNGAWSVRVRPNFGAVNGVFGPAQTILVTGTSASSTLPEGAINASERSEIVEVSSSIYPNPNDGSGFNVNFTELQNASVQMRVIDATGRTVFAKNYSVDGSLNQTIMFENQLAAGIYMVELIDGTEMHSQRIVVRN